MPDGAVEIVLSDAERAAHDIISKSNPTLVSHLKVVDKVVVDPPPPPISDTINNEDADSDKNKKTPAATDAEPKSNPFDLLLGGKFKGKPAEEVEAEINSTFENYQKINTEVVPMRERMKDLELAASMKSTDDTPDDILSLKEFRKQNPDLSLKDAALAYDRLTNFDAVQKNPMDILKMKYRLDNPMSTATDEAIERTLNKRYGLTDLTPEDEDYSIAMDELNNDGKKALVEILAKKDSFNVKKPETDRIKTVTERKAQWAPLIESVVKEDLMAELIPNLSAEEIKDLTPEEKSAIKYDVPVTKSELKAIEQTLLNHAITKGLPLTEDSVKELLSMARGIAIVNKLPNVVHNAVKSRDAYWKDKMAAKETEIRKEYENYVAPTGKQQVPNGEGKLNADQLAVNAALKANGLEPMY